MKVRKQFSWFHWIWEVPVTTWEQECPECSGPIVGRNFLVESIAAVVFSRELSMSNRCDDDCWLQWQWIWCSMFMPMIMVMEKHCWYNLLADYLKQLICSNNCGYLELGRCFQWMPLRSLSDTLCECLVCKCPIRCWNFMSGAKNSLFVSPQRGCNVHLKWHITCS